MDKIELYSIRFTKLLREIALEVRDNGFRVSKIADPLDDEMARSFVVYRGREIVGEVKVTLAEQGLRTGAGKGETFVLTVCADDGNVLSRFMPYSETRYLWVTDPPQLRDRWRNFFDLIDPQAVVKVLKKEALDKQRG